MASQRLSEAVVTEKRIIIDADLSLPKQAIEKAPEATVAVHGELPVKQNQALVKLYPRREEDCLAQAHLPVGMPAIAASGIAGPSQCLSEKEKTPMEPRTETNQPGDTYTCHLRPGASSAREKFTLSKDVISSKERNTSSFIRAAVETPPDPVHYTADVSSIVKPAETVISQPGHVKGLAKSAKFVHRRDILPKPDFILLPASKHRFKCDCSSGRI